MRIVRESTFEHFGIKGMRWGQRRYQNKDGSLTPAGKKRYDYPHQSERKIQSANKPKPVSQMTDSELQRAISRKRLENDYAKLFPKKKSFGQKAVDKFTNDILVPEITRAGQAIFRSMLNSGLKQMGVTPSSDKKKK